MERSREATAGRVPGMSPDDAEGEFQATRASQKNQRKKEQRREKAEAQDAQQRAAEATVSESAPVGQPAGKVAQPQPTNPESQASGGPQLSEEDKRKKALQKKLKQISDIEEKQAAGTELNQDQVLKLASKRDLENELKCLVEGVSAETLENDTHDNGAAAAAEEAAMPEEEQQEEAEAEAVAEEVPAPSEAPVVYQIELEGKSKKAIEKKLRQIAEIEKKQSEGETLNEDQLSKLKCKVELEAALQKF